MLVVDWIAVALVAGGLFFVLAATGGVLRFPDVYSRLHAASKASTLGVSGILLGTSLHFTAASGVLSVKELLTIVFLFLTSPVAAHMIARTAYLIGIPLTERSVLDEFPTEREEESWVVSPPLDVSPPPAREPVGRGARSRPSAGGGGG